MKADGLRDPRPARLCKLQFTQQASGCWSSLILRVTAWVSSVLAKVAFHVSFLTRTTVQTLLTNGDAP